MSDRNHSRSNSLDSNTSDKANVSNKKSTDQCPTEHKQNNEKNLQEEVSTSKREASDDKASFKGELRLEMTSGHCLCCVNDCVNRATPSNQQENLPTQLLVNSNTNPKKLKKQKSITITNWTDNSCLCFLYFSVVTILVPLLAVIGFFAALSLIFAFYVGLIFLFLFILSFFAFSSRYLNKNRNFLFSWWNGLICSSFAFCFYSSYHESWNHLRHSTILLLSFVAAFMILSSIYSFFKKEIQKFNIVAALKMK